MGMVYVDGQLVFQQEPSGPESEECGVGSPEQAVTVSIDLPWHTASTVTLRFDSNLDNCRIAQTGRFVCYLLLLPGSEMTYVVLLIRPSHCRQRRRELRLLMFCWRP